VTTTRQQLQLWLEEPEGTNLEFKEAKSNFHFDTLVEYCVALANEGGGKIILGITDRRPRVIVGSSAFAEPGRTEAGLYQKLSRRIPVEEVLLPEGRVLVVHVPARLPGTAWQINGRYMKRAGDELTALTDGELKAYFAETGPDFSAEICVDASIADLSSPAIAFFRDRWAKKDRDDRKSLWTDAETLANAELVDSDRPLYAALILFGTREALGRFLPQAELIFEYRSSEASGPAAAREEYREGFFLWQDTIWTAVNLRNDRQSYQDGLFRVELPTFDEVPVREALLNAVAHRDYRSGASIFVRQYPHRLEVVSPGGFPAGIDASNVLDQQNPRNRRLAEALGKCGLIERSGQGMNLMFETAIRHGKPLPSFAGTSDSQVWLTLDGLIKSPSFVRFIERLGQETIRSFSTDDFLALDCVHRELPLTDRLKTRITGLVAVGAVESTGRGRGIQYLLSKRFYAALGEKGVYTRRKGLDRDTNKALLEKHLSGQGAVGAALSELRQVLPSVSEKGVQSLLNELRREGRIALSGSRRWARWAIAVSKAGNEDSSA
jgi:ATP-dependent DNA helicase RecG